MSTLYDRLDSFTIPEALTGCWLCWASPNNKGYARLSKGKNGSIYCHRVSYERHKGPIPVGQMVLHRCDTPACVNPVHLFLGTNKENAVDREAKARGNQPIGLANGRAKISDEQAQRLIADRRPLAVLAAEYGLNPRYISALRTGRKKRKALMAKLYPSTGGQWHR